MSTAIMEDTQIENINTSTSPPPPSSSSSSTTFASSSITSPEMNDLWISIILPQLDLPDLVRFSLVSTWSRKLAHCVTTHSDIANVSNSIEKCWAVSNCWPHLNVALRLTSWNQFEPIQLQLQHQLQLQLQHQHQLHQQQQQQQEPFQQQQQQQQQQEAAQQLPSRYLIDVCSLSLFWCCVSNFELVSPARLEALTIHAPLCKFTSNVCSTFCGLVSACSNLTSLEMNHCFLRKNEVEDVRWLAALLDRLTKLTHLSLAYNTFTETQTCQILPSLSHMTLITSLDLRNNVIGPTGAYYLSTKVLGNMPAISLLLLADTNLGEEGATTLTLALASLKNLDYVDLSSNGVHHKKRMILAQVPQLKKIDL